MKYYVLKIDGLESSFSISEAKRKLTYNYQTAEEKDVFFNISEKDKVLGFVAREQQVRFVFEVVSTSSEGIGLTKELELAAGVTIQDDLLDNIIHQPIIEISEGAYNSIISGFAKSFGLKEEQEQIVDTDYSPEWFKEKALEFSTLDQEAEEFRQAFIDKFAPEKLKSLSDVDLLETIFLNANNKTNLCYTLEFDTDSRFIFGSIKSGTAYKYGLHYSQKNSSWATGTGRNPQFLSEEEAIELGTKIRDNLVAGVDVFNEMGDINSISDYEELFSMLLEYEDCS